MAAAFALLAAATTAAALECCAGSVWTVRERAGLLLAAAAPAARGGAGARWAVVPDDVVGVGSDTTQALLRNSSRAGRYLQDWADGRTGLTGTHSVAFDLRPAGPGRFALLLRVAPGHQGVEKRATDSLEVRVGNSSYIVTVDHGPFRWRARGTPPGPDANTVNMEVVFAADGPHVLEILSREAGMSLDAIALTRIVDDEPAPGPDRVVDAFNSTEACSPTCDAEERQTGTDTDALAPGRGPVPTSDESDNLGALASISRSPPIGAIIGGVVGGLLFVAIIALLFLRPALRAEGANEPPDALNRVAEVDRSPPASSVVSNPTSEYGRVDIAGRDQYECGDVEDVRDRGDDALYGHGELEL